MNRIPAFAFPAEVGTHLPTPEGWKAELAFGKLQSGLLVENHMRIAISQCSLGYLSQVSISGFC